MDKIFSIPIDVRIIDSPTAIAASVYPPYPGVILRRGTQGPSITQVQKRLNELGANPRLAIDGMFGTMTEAAVKAFQKANGLNPDGVDVIIGLHPKSQ